MDQKGLKKIANRFRNISFFVLVVLLGALGLAYSYFIEPRRLVVSPAEVKIRNLDPAFDGLRIVAIGDVHGGSNAVDEEMLDRVIALANLQDPDLVVLLGDYVAHGYIHSPSRPYHTRMDVNLIARKLGGLRAKEGVFAVLGNHDGWHGDKKIADELRTAGVRVLQNEIISIERNGKPLRIFGTIDHLQMQKSWKETSAELRTIVESSGSGDLIVLQHSPDVFPVITGDLSISDELRLMIAAHTHGGQIRLPLLGRPGVPSSYGQKYAYGHIRENDVDMFVTSGIGTSVLPFRLLVPPEIAVITLKAGN
ncbi:MAG: metallophosphoesterase [Acidobacteria bacterium]|nr:metallophosphoesterase [Acidobacteriota bacterium]